MGLSSDPPTLPPIGIDDYAVTLNLFGSALVGLIQRDKTGKGQYVEVSLQGTGVWTNAFSVAVGLVAKQQPPIHDRDHPKTLSNTYQTKTVAGFSCRAAKPTGSQCVTHLIGQTGSTTPASPPQKLGART